MRNRARFPVRGARARRHRQSGGIAATKAGAARARGRGRPTGQPRASSQFTSRPSSSSRPPLLPHIGIGRAVSCAQTRKPHTALWCQQAGPRTHRPAAPVLFRSTRCLGRLRLVWCGARRRLPSRSGAGRRTREKTGHWRMLLPCALQQQLLLILLCSSARSRWERVGPLGSWPDPKKRGQWAMWVGLKSELGQWRRYLLTHRVGWVGLGVARFPI
jgi:hypothetical protein